LELLAQSPKKPIKSIPKAFGKEEGKSESEGLNTDEDYNWTWRGALGLHSIKGGVDLKHWEQLKVTWVLECSNDLKSRQRLDLYDDKQVEKACEAAARKLRLRAEDLEKELNRLTELLEAHRRKLSRQDKTLENKVFELSAESKKAALEYLQSPNLLERLGASLGKTGIVGEEKARLMLLLIASSYKQKRPLHALIQGSSGSGKTLLLRKIMSLLPPPDCYTWSRVTESSLYNWGERLRHKAIGIEDWDGLTEEAQYALRELQTGGELRSSTSEKQENGKIEGMERVTSGPIASMMCTTHGAVYEDNMNRCFLIALDEGEAQTQKIIAYQNAIAEGLEDRLAQEAELLKIRNLVKILEPCEVLNPYASKVQLPPKAQKLRRLNQLYQDFVAQLVSWHQYQRKRDGKGRVIALPEDLKAAAELMFDSIVLKVDELDGSLRQFFERLKEFVLKKGGEECSFTQREARQALSFTKVRLHYYLQELMELEYVQISGGYANKGYSYRIIYWDDNQRLRADIKSYLEDQLDKL